MNGANQRPIAFVALNDVMQPDYRALIVRRALNFRRQAPAAARQRFDGAAAKHVKVATLDEHVTINPATLATLIQASQHDDQLMQAVLIMWQQSQLPLARRMREFLQSKGLEVHEFEHLNTGFLGTQPQDSMLALVNDFHSRSPSFNTYDIALMLCCVHGYLPGSAPASQQLAPAAVAPAAPEELPDMLAELAALDESRHTRWHRWLAEIHALPLEANEWDGIAVRAFAQAARRLGEQRQRERQERQARLINALKLLNEQAAGEIDYFGFGAARDWRADAVALNNTTAVAEEVTNFYTELMAHRSGLQKPPAETRAAQIARRNEIEALEEQIITSFAQLESHFTPAPTAATEPAPDEVAPVDIASSPGEAQLIAASSEEKPEIAMAIGEETPILAAIAEAPSPVASTNGSRRSFFRRK